MLVRSLEFIVYPGTELNGTTCVSVSFQNGLKEAFKLWCPINVPNSEVAKCRCSCSHGDEYLLNEVQTFLEKFVTLQVVTSQIIHSMHGDFDFKNELFLTLLHVRGSDFLAI